MKNVILVSILGAVTSIGGFQYWQHQQKIKDEFINQKISECNSFVEAANHYVNSSQPLSMVRNGDDVPGILHPGINAKFEKGSDYILIPKKGLPTLPDYVKVHDKKKLHFLITEQKYPKSVMVTAISIDNDKKEALVYSSCAEKKFTLPLTSLYVETQTFKHKNSNLDDNMYGF